MRRLRESGLPIPDRAVGGDTVFRSPDESRRTDPFLTGGTQHEPPLWKNDDERRRMPESARDQLAALLGDLRETTAFSATRTATAEDLQITVRGVGQLSLPVLPGEAELLRSVARPARYGQGEETLLDRRVRDTWEVPRSRVKIDARSWHRTVEPILELLARDLGMKEGRALEARLHSMLLYAPGQFFRTHQDSDRSGPTQ